jgi:DNA-binding NarL/FixJ family response regulator
LAERTKPDVVLLDVTMHSTDGFETLPLLLTASPTSRVVMLSPRSVTRDLRESAHAAGATAVLDRARSLGSIADDLCRLAESWTAGAAAGELIR